MTDQRRRVGLVHATPAAMEPMRAAFAAHLPDVIALNFLDEGLIDGLNRAGGLTPTLVRRLSTVVGLAEAAGVEVILMSCSGYSPVVDIMRAQTAIQVLPVDGVLIEDSVAAATHLGVLATSATSLRTTTRALQEEADRQGRTVRLSEAAEPEAFAAMVAGDTATGDARVAAAVRRLVEAGVDTVMLAQASLSRALPVVGDVGVPVLTSPILGVRRVARLLGLESS